MNREEVAMDLTVQNVEILRKEVQAAKMLLSECDEIFSEEGISNIELRGYLSGKLSADEVIELLASQQGERNQCDGCQAGIPLVDGAHRMGRPGGYTDLMNCQKERYEHPEQAEGAQGEREAFEAHESRERRLSPADQKFWFRRGVLADYDCKAIDDAWKAWKARAALAQPSPAPELEQVERFEPAHGTDRGGNVFAYMIDNEAGEYMEFAQHDRIVGALRAEVEEVDGLSKRLGELLSEITIIIRGPEPELTRWGYSDLPLRVKAVVEEVAALRARVVVLPSVDSVMNIVMRYQWNEKTNVTGTTNWAANLGMKVVDEVKRLNGKVVSEGLLRRIVAEPVGGAVYDAIAELRAMLGEGKDP